MNKPLSEISRPTVWVASSQIDSLPSELEDVGLLIELPSWEELPNVSRNKIRPCTVVVQSPNPGRARFSAKFVLLERSGEPPSQDRLRDKNLAKRGWMSLADFQSQFGPLALSVGDRQAYQYMFRQLSREVALRLLLLVNDLVALNELRPSSRILRQVRMSPHDLWSQFFREDEERFALVDFRRSMDYQRQAMASLADVESLAAEVPLWGGHFVLPLRLNFPVVLGQRQLQNVVIGPNGSGKTNLLLGLAQCVLNHRTEFGHVEGDNLGPGVHQNYRGSVPIQVVVFTYERAMWSTLRRKGVAVYEQGVRASDWRKLTQLIYEILSSRSENQDGLRDLRLLREILSGFIDVSELRLPLHPAQPAAHRPRRTDRDDDIQTSLEDLTSMSEPFIDAVARLDRGNAPFMRTKDGRRYTLSSGERSLVLFCARLMIASRDSALVLIDEPENHLHPRFITLMVQTLARTLQATGSRALIVTHSPFVVREFERSTVKVLKTSPEGFPEMFRPSLQTLGADVAMISDYVFEDEQIRKGFQESIDRAIRVRQLQGDLDGRQIENLAASLGEDAVSYLIERSEATTGEAPDA
ncbi:ATP-dependent endonuclease [Paraburkholderia sp. DGU8]|uniref:ATP-dependent nuclease n=1 Tax=Paraburkholderia sp. DGU8 TaxID=3161997 RepID=UPI003465277E